MSELAFGDAERVAPDLAAAVERCRQCSFELAADQRYCVNCGTRRAEARVDYRSLLVSDGGQPAAAASTAPVASAPAAAAVGTAESRAVSPLGAAVALGLVLLSVLLGAVIGQGSADSGKPVMVNAPPTSAQSTEAAAPTTTDAAKPTAKTTPAVSRSTSAKDSALAKSLTKSSGDAYSQKSTELKGLMATGN